MRALLVTPWRRSLLFLLEEENWEGSKRKRSRRRRKTNEENKRRAGGNAKRNRNNRKTSQRNDTESNQDDYIPSDKTNRRTHFDSKIFPTKNNLSKQPPKAIKLKQTRSARKSKKNMNL